MCVRACVYTHTHAHTRSLHSVHECVGGMYAATAWVGVKEFSHSFSWGHFPEFLAASLPRCAVLCCLMCEAIQTATCIPTPGPPFNLEKCFSIHLNTHGRFIKLLSERFPRALGPDFSASRLPSTSNIFKRVTERGLPLLCS